MMAKASKCLLNFDALYFQILPRHNMRARVAPADVLKTRRSPATLGALQYQRHFTKVYPRISGHRAAGQLAKVRLNTMRHNASCLPDQQMH